MKQCPKCEKEKPLSSFSRKSKGRIQTYCKECNRTYQRQHYLANKAAYREKAKQAKARAIEVCRTNMLAYLLVNPCSDCGETDPVVLQFDHRCPSDKEANVSTLMGNGYSWCRILKEIEKCDVVCANCHARRTALQKGWWYGLPQFS